VISFRQHLVSLVAVFLALAVGVVLGGGPLSELGRAETAAASTRAESGLEASYGGAFALEVAPAVLAGRLEDREVTVLTLPGADPETVDALRTRITEAGGRVAATYAVQPALLDAGEKALVDTLGSQLMTQYGRGDVATEAPTYERLGQLLALATATTDAGGEHSGARAASVVDSLTGAGLVAAESEQRRKAPLVLVVMGEEPTAETQAGSDAILAGLVSGLRAGAAGVVLAGDTGAGASGQLSRVREDAALEEVATVDGVETTVGQVTAVLALGRTLEAPAGDYGASGADGAVPLG
jgi:hypothetical protein